MAWCAADLAALLACIAGDLCCAKRIADEVVFLQVDAQVSSGVSPAHGDGHDHDAIIALRYGLEATFNNVTTVLVGASMDVDGKAIKDGRLIRPFLEWSGPVISLLLILALLLVILAGVLATTGNESDDAEAKAPLMHSNVQPPSFKPAEGVISPGMSLHLAVRPPLHSSIFVPDKTVQYIGPPPIEPPLIVKSLFVIGMEALMIITNGPLDIESKEGEILMRAILADTEDGGRCLAVAAPNCPNAPWVRIVAAPENGDRILPPMKVYARNWQLYGTLEINEKECNLTTLMYGDKPVMLLQKGHKGDFKITARSMDRTKLAEGASQPIGAGVGRHTQSVSGDWAISMEPRVDVMLIMGAMLAVRLLQPLGSSGTTPGNQ